MLDLNLYSDEKNLIIIIFIRCGSNFLVIQTNDIKCGEEKERINQQEIIYKFLNVYFGVISSLLFEGFVT